MEIIFTLKEINNAINFIIKNQKSSILRLDGEIGSGKTTLIKVLCRSLGVIENVSSPTFSLVNEYLINGNKKIYHFDFYRLKAPIEALDIGLEYYLESKNLCILEWGNIIKNYLPNEYDFFLIEKINDFTRKLIKINL